MQIDEALGRFVRQLEADGRSPHTIRQYQRHVRSLARWTADVGHSGDVGDFGHTQRGQTLDIPVTWWRHNASRTPGSNDLGTKVEAGF